MKSLTNEILLSLQNEIEEKRKKIEDTAICREDENKAVNRQRKFFNVLEDCIAEFVIEPTFEDIQRQVEGQMPNMKTDSRLWLMIPVKYGNMPSLPNGVTVNHFQRFVDRMIDEYHGEKLREMFPTMMGVSLQVTIHHYGGYNVNGITVKLPYPQPDLL